MRHPEKCRKPLARDPLGTQELSAICIVVVRHMDPVLFFEEFVAPIAVTVFVLLLMMYILPKDKINFLLPIASVIAVASPLICAYLFVIYERAQGYRTSTICGEPTPEKFDQFKKSGICNQCVVEKESIVASEIQTYHTLKMTASCLRDNHFIGSFLGIDFTESVLTGVKFQQKGNDNQSSGGYSIYINRDQEDITLSLHKAKFNSSILQHTDFNGASVEYADFSNSLFEPISLPDIRSMALAEGLDKLRWGQSNGKIIELYQQMRMHNNNKAEEVLYSLKSGNRQKKPMLVSVGEFMFAEFPTDWGNNPAKPIAIIIVILLIYAFIYAMRRCTVVTDSSLAAFREIARHYRLGLHDSLQAAFSITYIDGPIKMFARRSSRSKRRNTGIRRRNARIECRNRDQTGIDAVVSQIQAIKVAVLIIIMSTAIVSGSIKTEIRDPFVEVGGRSASTFRN